MQPHSWLTMLASQAPSEVKRERERVREREKVEELWNRKKRWPEKKQGKKDRAACLVLAFTLASRKKGSNVRKSEGVGGNIEEE